MDLSNCREASHAGSWYTSNPNQLELSLSKNLNASKKEIEGSYKVKAIIGPHAGYDYSGPTAAWAYQYLQPSENLRVFLLGPCHHTYIKGFGMTKMKSYKTPLGDIPVDQETIQQLVKEIKGFTFTDKETEEEEHSLEMHLPFIQRTLRDKPFKLVPLMIGATDPQFEEYLGRQLAKYFDDPNTIFVISSDFCHWGKRFQFTYHNKEDGQIYESIEKLDRRGADYIQNHDSKGFEKYIRETENTICGRHPIGVLLNIINHSTLKNSLKTKLVKYAQSGQVTKNNDSSVSYASLVTYINE